MPKKKKEMEPMSLLLNSTLNAEFVYIILEGISQFSLLNFVGHGLTQEQIRRFWEMKYEVGDDNDTTVKIDKMLIQK